jgi:tetratricopeptide (TPR) repeat protein
VQRTWKWVRRKPIHAALVALLVFGTPVVALLGQRTLEHRRLVVEQRLDALRDEVRFLQQRREHPRVVELTSEILRLAPDDPRAYLDRGVASMRLARQASHGAVPGGAEIADLRRRALEDIERIVALRPATSWPYRWKAHVLRELGRDAEAAEATALAARFRSSEPTPDELYWDAKLSSESGKHAEAVALFTRIVALRPDHRDALESRAVAREALGDLDHAVEDLRTLAALSPDLFDYKYNLGRLLTERGDLEEGEAFLRASLSLRPESPDAHDGLSNNLLKRGREAQANGEEETARGLFRSAEQAARASLERRPGGSWGHVNLGASLMELHRSEGSSGEDRIEEALTAYEQALAAWREAPAEPRGRDYGVTLSNICDALIEARRLPQALASCSDVTRVLPREPVAFYNLAGVHALMGQRDAALAALERDLALGDRDAETLAADPWFESLREDPAFLAIVERMRRAAAPGS